jgi:hypothetical protein
VLAWVPSRTSLREMAAAGLSPGAMSPGLGTVPPGQTYLDVGQGNRVFDSLYDEPLPNCIKFPALKAGNLMQFGLPPRCWRQVVERAESAPAEIVPGLLGSTLRAAGASRALEVRRGDLDSLPQAASYDLLIAIAMPTGETDEPLPIGIAGNGFDGDLTSDSTRTGGYVLSTDLAPTILERLGIAVPSEMSGQPIRSEGAIDPAAVESLVARMDVVSSRRGPVIGLNVAIWLAALLLAALLSRGSWTRPALRAVGLAIVYLPLVLLLGAALEPGQGAEQVLVLVLCPLLAALTLLLLGGYRALAAASALTVLAYAVDVVAGSPLTSLSLLGPNPGLGVRFYGIGNELEALLAVLVVGGTGAALTGFAGESRQLPPRHQPQPILGTAGCVQSRKRAATAFVAVGLLAAFVFATGCFGANVGAAIVFPVGAVVAAVTIAGRGRRTALLLVVAAPLAVLALLALIDLLSGANAHLTRSVLDAGGLGSLADVAQRRLQLSAHSFARPVLLALLPLVLAAAALAYLRRDRLRAWLERVPAMRAGLVGALAATLIGTLANDSGALLLEIGTAYLLVFLGFAWAESDAKRGKARPKTKRYTSVTQI